MGLGPFLLGSLIKGGLNLLGRRQEGRQAERNTDAANEFSRSESRWANEENKLATTRMNRFNVRQAAKAERRSDQNAKVARRYNAKEAGKARQFSKRQADKANKLSERRDLRNRDWAKDDYRQQKRDFASQYERGREAAVRGGFNPLTVLGGQMTPSMGAGGLSSSSYAAASGIGGSTGFSSSVPAVQGSIPMAYGAPVSVQPLVSNAGVVGSLSEIGMELTGAYSVQRQTDELYRDIAQIELDQLRSGVATAPPAWAEAAAAPSYPTVSQGAVPSLGSAAVPVTHFSYGSDVGNAPTSHNPVDPWSEGRGVDVGSTVNIPGYVELQNDFTDAVNGGHPIRILGDEFEVNNMLDGAWVAAQALPQMAYHLGERHRAAIDTMLFDRAVRRSVPPTPYSYQPSLSNFAPVARGGGGEFLVFPSLGVFH